MNETKTRRVAQWVCVGLYAAGILGLGAAILRPVGTAAPTEAAVETAPVNAPGAASEPRRESFPVVEADPEPVLVMLDHFTTLEPEPVVDPPETPMEDAQEAGTAPAVSEYPVAERVVTRLRGAGWGDVPIAGVLGNMMAEVGGQTLDLRPDTRVLDVDGVVHYGLCGWSTRFFPEADGQDVDGQVDVLLATAGPVMEQHGGSLDDYLAISDPEAVQWAGLYFSMFYERNIPDPTGQRALNAVAALEWIGGYSHGGRSKNYGGS